MHFGGKGKSLNFIGLARRWMKYKSKYVMEMDIIAGMINIDKIPSACGKGDFVYMFDEQQVRLFLQGRLPTWSYVELLLG